MTIQDSILCPIDFSECSQAALKEASLRAKQLPAKLYVLHVDDSGRHLLPGQSGYVSELDDYRRLLEEGKPTEAGVAYELHYMPGDPASEILRFAKLRQVGLIIMGTHGRSGLAKLLLGSIAERVTKQAACQVLTLCPQSSEVKASLP